MNDAAYAKFCEAKKAKDLNAMQKLYYSNSDDLVVKFEYAKLLILKGNKELGKKLLISLIGTKNELYAKFELGRLEKEVGNLDAARKYLKSLIGTKNEECAKLELGKLEADVGNVDQAREYFESLLKTKKWIYAKFELGRLEASIGNLDQARKCFKQLVDSNGDYYSKLELGKLEATAGNINKARKYFESLIGTKSEILAKTELGELELRVGNIDAAREYFESLIGTQNATYAILGLGKLEASVGNIDKARKYFESLLGEQNATYAYRELILLEYKFKNYIRTLVLIKQAISNNIDVDNSILISIFKEFNVFFKKVNYYNMKYSYSITQLLDYDEYLAIEHIVERHTNSNEKNNFSKNIDIYKLFNDVDKLLTEEYKFNKLNFNDWYIIPYDNIGSEGENFLKVVTLPHNKNIITMYPVSSMYDDYAEETNKKLIK